MSGHIKIIVSDEAIRVEGVLDGDNMIGRINIIDALMNAFDIKGDTREAALKILKEI